MDEYVVPIFLIALFASVLTFGFFFVRARTRDVVITLWGMHSHAQSLRVLVLGDLGFRWTAWSSSRLSL